MAWIGGAIAGGGALLGGLFGGSSAKSAAKTSANAQLEAARIAADAAKFRPYNITTALGGATFGDGTANITYNPELAAYRDRLFAMGAATLPTDVAAAEEAAYQRLKAGGQSALEQQTAALGTGLFRTGRAGLDIYGAQPEMRAFSASLMDRENALRNAARAEVAAKIGQSTGLTTAGFGTESALLQPLDIGAALGGRAATGNIAGAQLLGQAGQQAAQTIYGANLAQAAGMQKAFQTASPFLTDYLKSLDWSGGVTPRATGLGYNEMGTSPFAYQPQAATWNQMFGGTGGMGD